MHIILHIIFNAAYKNMSNAQFRHEEAYILSREMCSTALIVTSVTDYVLTGNQVQFPAQRKSDK